MKSTESDFNDEWSRVSQNPDNMIVSDVIKDSINKLFNRKEIVDTVPPVVSLLGSNTSLNMEMTRIDMSPMSWSMSCVASIIDGYSLIRTDRKEWHSIAVCAESGGDVLLKMDIRSDVIRVEVDFPANTGLCVVTLSYSNEREQKRIL